MSLCRAIIPSTLLAILVTTSGNAAEPRYYSFLMDGKSIGFAQVDSEEVTWNGEKLLRLRSLTTLKFAMIGTARTTVRRSTTLVRPDTGIPVFFDLTQDINGRVARTESKFREKQVETWQYQESESKGDAKKTDIESATKILGSNNFAHWGLLIKSALHSTTNGVAELHVFLPDAATTAEFRLKRSDPKTLDINGKSTSCRGWKLEGSDVTVYVDELNELLVRMEIPSQRTVVMLADKSVVQATEESGAPEILARHFAQSNVTFDDFMKVRMLTAKIDASVIGSGVSNAPDVLTTAMQQFEGQKQDAQISGTVTIRSVPYEANTIVAFPSATPASAQLEPWLKPEPLIESDFPKIVELAQKLTDDAKNRWDAVLAVANWVHKEIRYKIADTPSARLALETRKGDCGPHATLTVALLRAVGIPSRLVGGLVYTPSYGGSFGQHAWVEVHMGPDGWVAFDPTTGEHSVLSATHIKMFEGMGGVVPKTVEIVEYEPKNQEFAVTTTARTKPLPWKLEKDYTYTYIQNGEKLGTQTFQIQKIRRDGIDCYDVRSEMKLTPPGKVVTSTTRVVLQLNALPISYRRNFDVDGTKTTIDCSFDNNTATTTISGSVAVSREVKLQPGMYCFDNNLIPSFAMICSQLDLKEGSPSRIRTYHPSSMGTIPLSFEVKSTKNINVSGKEVECLECYVERLRNTFWVTRDGRLVRVETPGLVIDVSPVE